MKIFLFVVTITSALVIGCSKKSESSFKETDTTKVTDVPKSFDWKGTWVFIDNAAINYVLDIGEIQNEMYTCTYKAEGVQTAYELDCLGVAEGGTFKVYLQNIKSGSFPEDQINRDKPSLTLKHTNDQVVTFWDQFFNNYVEEGNHSGTVCFEQK